MNRYSELVTESLNSYDYKSFFEAVLSDTNLESDKLIRDWMEKTPAGKLFEIYNEILNDKSIRDSWQCRYKLFAKMTDHVVSNPQSSSASCKLDELLNGQGCKDKSASKNKPLIGKELKEKLYLFLKRVVVSVKSGDGGLFVVIGQDKCGKTKVLNYISSKMSKMKIESVPLESIRDSKRNRTQEIPDLIFIDDIDDELNMGLSAGGLLSLKSGDKRTTLIVSCRDLSSISKLTSYMEPKVLYIPEYSPEEMITILSSYRYRECLGLTESSCRDIINVLASMNEMNVLALAIEMMNISIIFKEDNTYDSQNNLNLSMNEIGDALLACTGRTINLDYDGVAEGLRRDLKSIIKGQDAAIDLLLPTLVNISTGLTDPSKPTGVVMAIGPTGVGKTEMGKAIADILYNGNCFKEDMNTYFEKHMVSKLVGSPPGYTGSQDIPPLLAYVKSRKTGVLILDEIEKANSAVHDMIMEMLDTGFMRDASGRLYDFRGFFIFMTSNAGQDKSRVKKARHIGFSEEIDEKRDDKKDLYDTGYFSKSFLARTSLIFFNELGTDAISEIAYNLVDDLITRLEGIGINISAAVNDNMSNIVDMVISKFDKDSGARSMKFYVEHELKKDLLEDLKMLNRTLEKPDDKTLEV